MGKCRSALKIHWEGQVGNLVGFSSHGNDYWRSLPKHYDDSQSDAQLLHRAKFSFVSMFIHEVGPIYKDGYRHFDRTKPARSSFFKHLYRDVVTGDLVSGFTVDFTRMLVARGSLTPAHTIAASVVPATQTVTISWSDNSGVGEASANDKLMYLFYNATKQVSICGAGVATRAEETESFTYPADWAGDTAYLYVAWANSEHESDSKMLGVYST